jgi:hypothetical protein
VRSVAGYKLPPLALDEDERVALMLGAESMRAAEGLPILAAWLLRQGEGMEVVAPTGLGRWVCRLAEVAEGYG